MLSVVPGCRASTDALGPRGGPAGPDVGPFVETIPGTQVRLQLLPVPAGAAPFTAEGELREVDVGPFWMSATEVPWEAYDALTFGGPSEGGEVDAESRPSKPYISMDRGYGHEGYPVISVSLHGANTFCEWLTRTTGRRYRLPTEAEWEYVCRAGSETRWASGDDEDRLADHAWFRANAERKTHPVGTKLPNAWGFFDMHGNAAEWCRVGDGGVVRGGSFKDRAADVASSARREPSAAWNASDPQIPKSKWWLADAGFIGFRVVCEGPAPAAEGAEEE